MKKYFAFIAILTIIVFTFTSKEKPQHTNASTYPPVTVKCKNVPIPNFTLNYDSDPSEEKLDQLCNCIWERLVGWEKDTVIKLSSGKEDEISAIHMAGFPAIFGKRISECGVEDL